MLTDVARGGAHGRDLLQQKGPKHNQQREKTPGVRSGGDKEKASKGAFPVGPDRTQPPSHEL